MNDADNRPAVVGQVERPVRPLVERLRDTPNWMRESFGGWKDCVLTYDRAPFEAADEIERAWAARDAAVADLEAHAEAEVRRAVAAERDRYAPLLQAVEWLLDDGHMDTGNLARLRAAFERA